MTPNRDLDDDLPPLGIQRRYNSPQPLPISRLMIQRFKNSDEDARMAVDGSITPVSFTAPIPDGFNCLILGMSFWICDTGLRPSRFGGLTALANGCVLSVQTAARTQIVFGDLYEDVVGSLGVYKSNAEWSRGAGTNMFLWLGASGQDDMLSWAFDFSAMGISPQLEPGDLIEMLVQDDLTGLIDFQGTLVGRLIGP